MIRKIFAVSAICLFSITAQAEEFSPYVDASGNITLPENFAQEMSHLGAWFVPEGGASGFHNVYTQKSTIEAFQKTGKFPDGAVLVKELRASTSGDYTTGENVSHATGQLKQWFVMVKDTKGRFAKNPLWGDGWGWALFKPDNKKKNVAMNYKNDCLSCHAPVEKKDWVYTEGYPSLNKQ